MDELAQLMGDYLRGEEISFPLDALALDSVSPFQRRVLVAEHSIPRGSVSTYGRIAAHLSSPDGARAVGRALATNPFPVLIPCHRAVRSDGRLGGYQGGLRMKRALLAMEGVRIGDDDRVVETRMHY
jgi:methylated-DNA-[protein]-cysteine S-methyltransferase